MDKLDLQEKIWGGVFGIIAILAAIAELITGGISAASVFGTIKDVSGTLVVVVVLALVPAFLVSIFYFGLPVIILTCVSVGCCMLFEYLIQRFIMHVEPTITDGSAAVTGMLLAFNVPANLPIWMLVIGALVAIGVAKMPFGGLGHNPFNPALVARVFMLISFPVAMTTWPVPTPVWGFADAVTGPTPLGILKESANLDMSQMPTYANMLLGQMGGSFGEVSAIALLIGAGFLMWRRIISWHIPVAFSVPSFLLASFTLLSISLKIIFAF